MTPEQEEPSVERGFEAFEKALLANALQLARSGALNSKSSPGIDRARSLLASKRNQKTPSDHAKRLGDLDKLMGAGGSILETVKQISDNSVYEAKLAKQEAEMAKENCRRRDLDAYDYLKDVLTGLPYLINRQIPEVLPAVWGKPQRPLQVQSAA